MKKLLLSLIFLLVSYVGFSQKGLSYQAVILDPNKIEVPGQDISGQPLVNGDVWMKFSIYNGSTLQFEEVHKTKTDNYGLVNLLIGSVSSASFNSLVWDSSQKILYVYASFDQGSSYTKISEQKLTYNPYALFSETAGKLSGTLSIAGGGTGATTAADARANLGLDQVNNTSDAAKPVSAATQTALDLKANAADMTAGLALKANTSDMTSALALKANTADVNASLALKADTTYVLAKVAAATIADADANTKGKIKIAGDLGGTADAPTVPGLALKANTSDVNTVLDLKANTTDMTSALALKANGATVATSLNLKENTANKSLNVSVDGSSDIKYPSVKAVKTYVDTQLTAGVASATIADANTTTKGKIKLTGDLGGTADTPTVPALALKANAADLVAGLSLKANSTDVVNSLNLKANATDITSALALKANASELTTGLALKLNASQLGVANGVASLNSSGIIPSSQLPPVTLSSTSVVASDADMIALSNATVGSIAVRTDVNKNYVLSALPASTLGNWIELLTPAAPVQTVNGYTGAINITNTDVGLGNVDNTSDATKPVSNPTQTALNLKLDANKVGVASGVASLNALGKVPTDQIPAISFSSVKVLSSQADMLALSSAVVGSVVIRTDVNKNYVLAQANPSVLANWIELLTPAPPVQTVNGYTGSVSITKSDVGLANAENTSDANKPISTATQTALNLKANSADITTALAAKAPLASPTFTGTVSAGVISATSITAPTYASAPKTLTYTGSAINWNPAQGLNAAITLTQNSSLSFTAAPPIGSYGTVVLTQDATGTRTITLPTISGVTNKVLGSTSTTTVVLSTAANSKDILNFYYDGTNCYWNIGQGYGAAATASTSTANLASGVTGTLAVTNGGTGATTLTGLIKGNGTSALTTAVAGTDYQAPLTLTTSGSGAATLSGTTLNIPIVLSTVNASSISGTVSVANGGTGATSKTTAFDALSPMTTAGDLIYGGTNGTGVRLGKGNNGTVLTMENNIPTWLASIRATAGSSYNSAVGFSFLGGDWARNTGMFSDNPDGGGAATLKFRIATSNSTADPYLEISPSKVSVFPTTASTSKTTGALTVAGGLGVTENIYASNLNTSGTITSGAVTYPIAHGTSGQMLTTTGSGTLSWTTPASPGVPYTGATGAVNLGAYNLTVSSFTIGQGKTPASGDNLAIGRSALNNTTGNGWPNIGLGSNSLNQTTDGRYNIGLGFNALYANTTGSNNIGIGYEAGRNASTSSNITAVGMEALRYESGAGNTAVGSYAGKPSTSAVYSGTTNSTFIGYNTTTGKTADATITNSTAIGYGASVTASHTIQLGNTSVTDVKTSGALTTGAVTYPIAHGTANQVLTTTGSGTLTWTTPASGGGSTTHSIGEAYGGGIVIYTWDGGAHGLIAATSDLGKMGWNATGAIAMARANGIGAGKKNTELIISQCGYNSGTSYAAQACNEYTVSETIGGVTTIYGDWYLGSKYEIQLMIKNRSYLSGLSNSYYWSSTERTDLSDKAWYVWRDTVDSVDNTMPNTDQWSKNNTNTMNVRPIRMF